MRIRIYDVSQKTGEETERATCDLSEAFPEPDDAAYIAGELEKHGDAWTGGGAAPLVHITPVQCPECSAAVGAAVPI